jgi:NAD(P)-dependent dehydrogenase (short-subunit alcohol dehydrogenase family)
MVEQALEAFGRLDIDVPNAATSSEKSVHRMPPDHLREVMEINFFGSLYLTHAAIPHLRAEGYGRLVFIISTAGLHGGHGLAAHGAAKAALVALMQCVAVENREKGIRSNALAPHAASRMTRDAMSAPISGSPRWDVRVATTRLR